MKESGNMYAKVIVEIGVKNVDREFVYQVPSSMIDDIKVGCRVKVSFGIGTNITNNLSHVDTGERIKPLNIVCKLTSCQMNPRQPIRKCVKLSDVRGKENGDPNEVKLYRQILGLED